MYNINGDNFSDLCFAGDVALTLLLTTFKKVQINEVMSRKLRQRFGDAQRKDKVDGQIQYR